MVQAKEMNCKQILFSGTLRIVIFFSVIYFSAIAIYKVLFLAQEAESIAITSFNEEDVESQLLNRVNISTNYYNQKTLNLEHPKRITESLQTRDDRREVITQESTNGTQEYRRCLAWMTEYSVRPGIDWGKLPENLRTIWRELKCDSFEQIISIAYKNMYEEWRKESSQVQLDDWDIETKRREESIFIPYNDSISKVTVVVSRFRESDEDIKWLASLPSERFMIVFGKRTGGLSNLPSYLMNRKIEFLPEMDNFADEAIVFLQYILLNYNDSAKFSPYTAFVHAKEFNGHTKGGYSMGFLLSNWNYGLHPYTSLNQNFICDIMSSTMLTRQDHLFLLKKVFIPNGYSNILGKHHCFHSCSQFIVSRERILATPR